MHQNGSGHGNGDEQDTLKSGQVRKQGVQAPHGRAQ